MWYFGFCQRITSLENKDILVVDVGSLGYFDGKDYVLPIRIYYEDTDLSGVVYHVNYLRYMDRSRSEFLHTIGIFKLSPYEGTESIVWTVGKVELQYFHPARLGDLIEVHTKVKTLTGARIVIEHTIFLSGILLTRGLIEICTVTLCGKLRRISQEVRNKVLPFLYEDNA